MNQLKNPQPFAPAITHALMKKYADDFIVKELLDIEFCGTGEHLWVYIKKTNVNTAFMVKLLSQWANIKPVDIGFSGLKDRHAVTYQWFSLRLPKKSLPDMDFDTFIHTQKTNGVLHHDEHIELLNSSWHSKKLSRGTHKFNEFHITLRNVLGDKLAIDDLLNTIKENGVPNYFGEQRFGNDGNNIVNAQHFFQSILAKNKPYKPHKKDIHKHSIYISTAKSLIFNTLLGKRILDHHYDTPITGDVFNLSGTGSVFCDVIDETLLKRLADKDIHIASFMFGTGKRLSADDARALENKVLDLPDLQILRDGLLKVGTQISYRPLRLLPQELLWHWDNDCLVLQFTLPTGGFATSVLSALGNVTHHQNVCQTPI